MKIIKNKKLFGYINIFDGLFLLLIILLLLASYYRYYLSSDKELFVSDLELEYTGYISKVDSMFIDDIKVGDRIYMVTVRENTYLEIGEVKDIELIPYKEENTDYVGFYDVILTISEKGNKLDDDYLSHTNVELHVGSEIEVVTKYTNFEMQLQNIIEL